MDGNTGPGGPTASLATGSLYNSSELRQQGGGPLTSLKAGRHRVACKHLTGHLERLAKVEVHQGVHSQELSQLTSPSPRGGGWRLRAQHRTSPS